MSSVLVIGPSDSPVAEIAEFLRAKGIRASHVYCESIPLFTNRYFDASFGEASEDFALSGKEVWLSSNSARSGANDTVRKGVLSKKYSHISSNRKPSKVEGSSLDSRRCIVAVYWQSAGAVGPHHGIEIDPQVLVVVGSTKREVVSASASSEADYAVLWPKEKELLATIIKAEVSAADDCEAIGRLLGCVGVSSVKSAGATLFAANLASQLSSMGKKVCLLDFDDRFRELSELVGDEQSKETECSTESGFVRLPVAPSIAGSFYAISGRLSLSTQIQRWDRQPDCVIEARSLAESEGCELLVIDVPPLQLEALSSRREDDAIPSLDLFFLVTPFDYFGVRQAHALFSKVDKVIGADRSGVLLCTYRGSARSLEDGSALFGNRFAFELPWIPKEAGEAIDEGSLLCPSDRNAYGRAVAEIAEWILQRLPTRKAPRELRADDIGDSHTLRTFEWSKARGLGPR